MAKAKQNNKPRHKSKIREIEKAQRKTNEKIYGKVPPPRSYLLKGASKQVAETKIVPIYGKDDSSDSDVEWKDKINQTHEYPEIQQREEILFDMIDESSLMVERIPYNYHKEASPG